MKTRILYLLCLGCFASFFSSCDDCSFTSENLQTVRVRLLSKADSSAVSVAFVGVTGAGSSQEPLYADGAPTSQLALPLLTSTRETVYVFDYADETLENDTLSLGYDVLVIPHPPDCGVDEEVSNLRVLESTFDSTSIIHTTLLNVNEYDMEIFF